MKIDIKVFQIRSVLTIHKSAEKKHIENNHVCN